MDAYTKGVWPEWILPPPDQKLQEQQQEDNMSILYRGIRPLVSFDVSNAEHRKWYAEFVKYRTWGRCPVRFLAESLDQDLVTYIERKMLVYYVNKEFENDKNKNTN